MRHAELSDIASRWTTAMLVLILLLGAGTSLTWLRLARDAWRIAEHPAPGTPSALPVRLDLAGEALAIPADLIRVPPGATVPARVELRVPWSLLPGFSAGAAGPGFDMALIAGGGPFPAEERLARLYRPFFQGSEIAGPEGLVGHRLAPRSGYGGETLYFEPAVGDAGSAGNEPFIARCASETTEFAPATCFRRAGVSPRLQVEYRFRKSLLYRWREIDAAIGALIERFREAPTGTTIKSRGPGAARRSLE